MTSGETVYILGSGAIGFPLAVFLTNAGKKVVAVRTGRNDIPKSTVTVTVGNGPDRESAAVETVSLSRLSRIRGTIVVCAKSYANSAIAHALQEKAATGSIVVMQNGVGVERPFLELQFPIILRSVLYMTSQANSQFDFTFRPIRSSPTGIISGDESNLKKCVTSLTTPGFPLHAETNIQREVWKKAIINSVFNSICPLLDVDNGIFVRDEDAVDMAREVVNECVTLTDRLNLDLGEGELMEQIMAISQGSQGQLISTLQDIRRGRPTEIDSLNLEIARVAASVEPGLNLPRTELLGRMTLIKSMQAIQLADRPSSLSGP